MIIKEFKIGSVTVGINYPPYFIADIGANHDGDINRAFQLIELAKQAGADAVKFQNFKANKIVSRYGFDNLNVVTHQSKWNKNVYDVYEDASIEQDWTVRLKEKCDEVGVEYFTSPYDFDSVDHVDPFVNVYKIGSGDITWLEIIDYIAQKGKPVILASGAATLEDVERAMSALEKYNIPICLMQCNTNYTVDADKYRYVNLNVLKTFQTKYPDTLLGLSDHTIGVATVAGSIALGARLIEKHFTDDNNRVGPDHKFAMNPTNWRQMVDISKEIFEALGDGIKRIEDNEKQSQIVQQRAIRATKNLAIGIEINTDNLEQLRPCPTDAIKPYDLNKIIGKKLIKPLAEGEHITWKHLVKDDD